MTYNRQILVILLGLVVFSGSIPFSFSEDEMIISDIIQSPKKQMESGVLHEDVICRENKVLVIRSNGNPACVSEKTANKMNWKIIETKFVQSGIELSDQSSAEQNISKLIINPQNLTGIIPQDMTFDYVLKMPPDDPDAFAQRMATFFNDTITKSDRDERYNIYTTERGSIIIFNEVSTRGYLSSTFEYTFFGEGRINPSQADTITTSLLEELGITMDGTEIYKQGHDYTDYDHYYMQTKDDLRISSNLILTDFDPGYTFIKIGNWNNNLSEMNLYDIDKARENGRQHIFKYPEFTGSDCDVFFSEIAGTNYDGGLHILNGRPVYQFYAGSCSVEYMVNHSEWFDVFVDAITGEPLYIQNRTTF